MADKPSTYIQWKGTDVCLDFGCTCGSYYHFDAEFLYAVKCRECGKVWKMGTEVEAEELLDKDNYWYKNAKLGESGDEA